MVLSARLASRKMAPASATLQWDQAFQLRSSDMLTSDVQYLYQWGPHQYQGLCLTERGTDV